EDAHPVAGAEEIVDRALGVRHHPEDVAGCVHDARDCVHRSIRTPPLVRVAGSAHVTKDDSTLPFDSSQSLVVGRVATVTVRDGYGDQLAPIVPIRELGVSILDTQTDSFADKPKARVARSEERRVGKEGRAGGAAYDGKSKES